MKKYFQVWNKASTVWPDFTHPNATSYWVEMFTSFYKSIPYDGIWIVRNFVSNLNLMYEYTI